MKPGAARRSQPPREVRIVGGRWKRSRLPVADSPGLRPTPDRVRETLFNWLGQRLDGWHCLDAFAGSGALGLEAASRGAARVVLLERDPALARGLRETVARLHGEAAVQVECAEALGWMRKAAPASFDLVLLDPPFDAGLAPAALAAARPLLRPGGCLYLEAGEPLDPAAAEALLLDRQGRAGAVHYHLLRAPDRYTGRATAP